ncbi:ThiF family adenylyltransferase [Patescibacteria group bacterium]|nr:ThiF family adenylyltransferase [Patescibacteria group bacterium]
MNIEREELQQEHLESREADLRREHFDRINTDPTELSIYPCDEHSLEELLTNETREVVDNTDSWMRDIFKALYPHLVSDEEKFEAFKNSDVVRWNWVNLPSRRIIEKFPEEDLLYRVLTSRNRDIITEEEQKKLKKPSIGIVGLSVGQSSTVKLVETGIGSEFKLADPDRLDASNLGRLSIGGCDDIDRLKTYIASEWILSRNPYLHIKQYNELINAENMREFLDGLDFVVDAFDTIQAKITLRRIAKELGITVVMGTDFAEGAIIDVEKPSDPIFFGSLSEEELLTIENMENIPDDMRNMVIAKLLGFKSMDELPESLRRHLESMKNGKLPWMSQLGIASAQVGILVSKSIKNVILGRPTKGRTKLSLDELLQETI